MKKFVKVFLLIAVISFGFASCNTYRYSMREPNSKVEFQASDFNLSGQVSGEATIVKIIGIDWQRLFGDVLTGTVNQGCLNVGIPVVGDFTPMPGCQYALYDMMKKNPGYDVVFYPQFYLEKHAPILGTDIYSTTKVKATARLGKLK